MKSKISFFNKTIFKKNMTLYWPIWALYTLILIIAQPLLLWSDFYYSHFYDAYPYIERLEDFLEVLYLDPHVYLIAIFALCTGMALFLYMYNHKSANMIHALPVDRTQLFGTNVISGLLFLAGPQTISIILTIIVALCNGVKEVYYAFYWLLLAFGTDIVAMAVVTFCAMFTGHVLALPVYAVVVNFFSWWVYYLLYISIVTFGYGVNSIGRNAERIAILFSPTGCFAYNIGFCENFDPVTQECIGGTVYGVELLAIYLFVAAVLYVVAYLTYRKRHIEQAGEFITVSWVKPIARFIVAVTGGFFGGMMIREFLRSVGIGCNATGFVIAMLVVGMIAYFIADMLIKKSFHVFAKKNWIGCGICSVALLISFFGMYGIAKSYEDYQPKMAEIESASVNMGYEVMLEGEEIETILAIHDEILKNKELCIRFEESGNRDYQYVGVHYYLKNGDYVSRSYELPNGYEEINKILEQITVLEQDVDNYLQYAFTKDYKEIEKFNGGWFEAQFMDKLQIHGDGEIESHGYDTKEFTAEQAKEMFEAVLADAQAGTLMKYNVHSQWIRDGKAEEYWKYSEAGLMIEFLDPSVDNSTHLVIEENSFTYPGSGAVEYIDTMSWNSAYLSFGPDCENIVNKLIEFEFIESVDDIWWGEFSEDQLKYQ